MCVCVSIDRSIDRSISLSLYLPTCLPTYLTYIHTETKLTYMPSISVEGPDWTPATAPPVKMRPPKWDPRSVGAKKHTARIQVTADQGPFLSKRKCWVMSF